MSVRVRFAPAPTGQLHLGNARTALLNALFAHHMGGEFYLRMDDTDTDKCDAHYQTLIQEDLAWLGITWDHFFQQSHRHTRYVQAFDQLQAKGFVYACYETPEELEAMRQDQRAKGLPPHYHRSLDASSLANSDRVPYWRFALDQQSVQWTDLIQGDMSVHMHHQSDPVVRRHDGSMSYLLASAIDDVDTGITHILRGADHLTNSAIQTVMMRALDGVPPQWAHLPLMVNESGEKFSKRKGSLSIAELRQEGWMPLAIVHSLVQLGLSYELSGSWEDLGRQFSLQAYRPSVSQYSLAQLSLAQERLWAQCTIEDLPSPWSSMLTPDQWLVLRCNLSHPDQLTLWQRIGNDASYDVTGHGPCPLLPDHFWPCVHQAWQQISAESTTLCPTWSQWKDALHHLSPDITPKNMAQGIRWALTGLPKGPTMEDLIRIIAPEVIGARLHRALLVPCRADS